MTKRRKQLSAFPGEVKSAMEEVTRLEVFENTFGRGSNNSDPFVNMVTHRLKEGVDESVVLLLAAYIIKRNRKNNTDYRERLTTVHAALRRHAGEIDAQGANERRRT
jgi:hypothetical protein